MRCPVCDDAHVERQPSAKVRVRTYAMTSTGLNLVNNKLGRPEPLVRPEQFAPQVTVTFSGDAAWLSDFVQTEITYADDFARAVGRGA